MRVLRECIEKIYGVFLILFPFNFVFDLAKKSVLPGGGVVWFRKSRKFNTDGMYPVEDHKDYRGWGKKG